MKGKRISYNDEVTEGMAKNQEDTGHMNTTANEKFANGTNNTKPHKHNKPPKGPYGKKGQPS